MTEKYDVKDILDAVDTLLDKNKKMTKKNFHEEERPLKLTNEVGVIKTKNNNVPKDTEKIILQAEKFLKK